MRKAVFLSKSEGLEIDEKGEDAKNNGTSLYRVSS